MYISLITAGTNIVFDVIFAYLWGAAGVALATTVVTFVALALYTFNFRKKIL
jgi:Na+-driven multidrug efflux pump